MPECDYCEESFESDAGYLRHLKTAHEGELSRVDRRRVEDIEEESSVSVGAAVLVVTLVAAFGIVAYVVVSAGGASGGSDEPTALGSTHEHGTVQLSIAGSEIDLNQEQYLENDDYFHFHGNDDSEFGYVWHVHGQGVTIQYALETLGIAINDDGTELEFDGVTYSADESGTEIVIEVNGESVDPGEYELDGVEPVPEAGNGGGDQVVIEVRTDS